MDKQTKKSLFTTLDRIYKVSKSISKQFGLDTISLAILKPLIDQAKFTLDNSNRSIHDYLKSSNDLLDKLYEACEESVKTVKSDHLAPAMLRLYINEIKKGINELKTN